MAGLLTNGMLPGTPTFQTQQAFDPLADAKKRYVDGQGGTWSGDRYYTDQKDPTTGLAITHDFSGLTGTAAAQPGGWSQSATDQYNAWQPADGVAKNITNYSVATGQALPAMGGSAGTPADGDFSKPWTAAQQPTSGNTINSWDAYGQTPSTTANPYLPQSMQQQQVFTGGGSSQQANQVLAAGTPESYQAPAFNPPVTTQGATPAGGMLGTAAAQPTAAQQYLATNPDVANAYANLTPEQITNWFGGNRPTAEQFAQTHYTANGQKEGRQWGTPTGTTGNRTGTTGSPTGMLPQANPATPFTQSASSAPAKSYFDANPDVAEAYKKNAYGMTPEEFARAHYYKTGKTEGRAKGWVSDPVAGKSYFEKYPDVAAEYAKNSLGMSPEEFAENHFYLHGRDEGRQNFWGGSNRELGKDQGGYSFNGSTYDAKTGTWNVTADQTVEGRLAGLLDDNNPLVEMARTQGLQDAQSRGLLNSSLGAQAGALAAYQYAMPIATSDANTFASAARQNASETTQTNLSNAGAQNTRGNLEYSSGVQQDMQQAGFNQADRTLASQQTHDTAMQADSNKASMDRLNAQINASVQSAATSMDASTRQSYLSAMSTVQSNYQQFVNAIQTSDIPQDAKTSQLDQAFDGLRNMTGMYKALFENMPNWDTEWTTLPPTRQA